VVEQRRGITSGYENGYGHLRLSILSGHVILSFSAVQPSAILFMEENCAASVVSLIRRIGEE